MRALQETSPPLPNGNAVSPMARIMLLQAKLQDLRHRSYESDWLDATRAYDLAAGSYELLITSLRRELARLNTEQLATANGWLGHRMRGD